MGGSDAGIRASFHALALAALTVTLFAAAGYLPVVGILVSLLAPTPIIFVVLRYGLTRGLLALAFASLCLALVFSSLQSAIFLAEYGVMAIAMGEAISRRRPVEQTLAVATFAPLVASGLILAAVLWSADVDLKSLWQQFETNLDQSLQTYLIAGENTAAGEVKAYIQEALRVMVQLLPALFIVSTAMGAALNYAVARLVWRRVGGPPLFPEASLAQWKAPEPCVWVLIGGGILYFIPVPNLQLVGLNVLLLVSLVYLIQGLGIMLFYLQKASVPLIFRGIAYVVLVLQPVLLLGVAAFGLFDLWFDFRRTRKKREDLP